MKKRTDPSVRWHGLDTLRALAILAVMLFHFNLQQLLPPALAPAARVGWVGVDLFFVLSGFLIGSQLLRPYRLGSQPSLRDFYLRRAYRILPAFLAVLLLYLAVPLWRESPGPYAAWQYATFTWNLLLLGYPESHAFSHIWSLCVEEHFYLALPLLVRFGMSRPSLRRTVLLLLLVLLGGVCLRAWLLHAFIAPSGDDQGLNMMRFIYYPTYSRLDGLLAGVSLALLRVFRPQGWSRFTAHTVLLPLGGVVGVLAGLWLCDFNYPSPDRAYSLVFAFPALACGFGCLVASAASSQGGWLARRVPGAQGLAALAFSLYLTHKSVAHATHLLLPGVTAQRNWQALGLYLAACLCAAGLLYLLVERPFLALRIQRSLRHSSTAVERERGLDPAL